MATYCCSFRSLVSSFYLRLPKYYQYTSKHVLSLCNCSRRNCSSKSSSIFPERNPEIIQPNIKKQVQESQLDYVKISKAMKLYLEKNADYDKLLNREKEAYELGRRHLANIMGKSPETFDEADIKEAISYLMPSALTSLSARPVMLGPEKLFPKNAGANFDVSGRPHNTFFYTMKPNFFTVLHTAVSKLEALNKYEDTQISKGIFVPPEDKILNLRGTDWLSQDELEKMLSESLPKYLYREFIYCFNNVGNHPYSFHEKEFLFMYRIRLPDAKILLNVPEAIMREDGRLEVETLGKRKHCKAIVKVTDKGSGIFRANNQDIRYFVELQNREQIMFPLQFTGYLHKVDVECTLQGKGESAQAGAIRHGISLALAALVSSEERERMRIAGLLTRDVRMRERKKPGQKGARAKYPWKRR